MSSADRARPIGDAELDSLFGALRAARALVLAVSGGPDSTALLLLAARWRRSLERGPALLAVTVDHGLRREAKTEATAVKRFAKACGVAHRTLRWTQPKPTTGLQRAARTARYCLLGDIAARFGADHVVTAHTLDDQAETVLIRLSRGSGLTGLGGMAPIAPLPESAGAIRLARPFLGLAKARLIATLEAEGIAYVDDPSNRDPRYARARLRSMMPALAREGLDARRLSHLARRARRAAAALEAATDAAWQACVSRPGPLQVVFDRGWAECPAEVRIRLLGRAVAAVGNEGPVQLAKLEALHDAVAAALTGPRRLRRTLAGAIVIAAGSRLCVERAPPRRPAAPRGQGLNHARTLQRQVGRSALE